MGLGLRVSGLGLRALGLGSKSDFLGFWGGVQSGRDTVGFGVSGFGLVRVCCISLQYGFVRRIQSLGV